MSIEIPLRVSSRSNSREHWAKRAKVTKGEREITHWACSTPYGAELLRHGRIVLGAYTLGGPRLVVRLVRCAPRGLDDDNLRDALKAVRDEIAAMLGLTSDRDERVLWEYGQSNGRGMRYAVKVEVEEERTVDGTVRSKIGA